MDTDTVCMKDLEHAQCLLTSKEKIKLKTATDEKRLSDAIRFAVLFFLEWKATELENEGDEHD